VIYRTSRGHSGENRLEEVCRIRNWYQEWCKRKQGAQGHAHRGVGIAQCRQIDNPQTSQLLSANSILSSRAPGARVGPHLEFPGVNVVPEDAGRAGMGEDVRVPQHDAPVWERPVAGLRPRAVVVHERDSLQHERPQVNQAPAA
jgi:hypothetical protein